MENTIIAPVRIGIIGAGMISGIYLDTLKYKFSYIEIVSIADVFPEKAIEAAKRYGIKACSIEELLDDPDIEIVLNLTPPVVHEEIISRILNAGKHAYTEKSLAMDLASGIRMQELADSKGLLIGSAPDTFFAGWVQTARKIIDSGQLGTITSFAMIGNRDNERLLSEMAYLSKPGGGIILDYSVYYLTVLINLLGPVSQVSASVKAPYPTHVNRLETSPHFGETFQTPNESQLYSVLEMKNGITGTLSINADSVYFDQTYFAVYGSRAIMYLGCPDWFNGSVSLYENTYDFEKAEFPVRVPIQIPFAFNENSRGVGVADMAVAIREKRDVRAGISRALHVLDVQECMVRSNANDSRMEPVRTNCERALPLRIPTEKPEDSLFTV